MIYMVVFNQATKDCIMFVLREKKTPPNTPLLFVATLFVCCDLTMLKERNVKAMIKKVDIPIRHWYTDMRAGKMLHRW